MEQLNQSTNNIDYTSEEVQKYIALFVGEKFNSYYKKAWENNYNKVCFFNFNISAFFLNTLWFYYRKMYKEGIICGIVSFFFISIVTIYNSIYNYSYNIFKFYFLILSLYICFGVIIAFLGNYLYLKNVKINISKLMKKQVNNNIAEYLEKRKCTNNKIVVILIAILVLPFIILFFAVIYLLFTLYMMFRPQWDRIQW